MATKRLRMSKVETHEPLNNPVLGSSNRLGISELDLFSTIPQQDDIQKVIYETFWPQTGSLLDTNPKCVFVTHPSEYFTDLSDSYFRLEVQLTKTPDPAKKDDTAVIGAEDLANVANLAAFSLWKDLTLYIAGRKVTTNYGYYYYESYLKILTQCTEEAKKKWCVAGFYSERSAELLMPNDPKADAGTKARYERFGLGNKQVLYMPIMSNLCSQMRYIPSLCEIKIELTKGPKEWSVIQPKANKAVYRLHLSDIQLCLKRPILYPLRMRGIEQRLSSSSNCNYYINNSYLRPFQIDKGTVSTRIPNLLLTSYLPSFCYIAFIQSSDLDGDYNSTNFNFELFGLTELYLQVVSKNYFILV